jgi:hypothetical protein
VRNSQPIADFLEERIFHICQRPLMYGGTPDGVELTLHDHLDVWALIYEREDEFQRASWDVHAEEECGSAGFTFHYLRTRPDAPDEETVEYVVDRWKRIIRRLGIRVDE